MKILNLFSGIGGNRELWNYSNVEITAVEYDDKIAKRYMELFPDDIMIIGDAYSFFEDNFEKFDIVWASPPCVSHSNYVKKYNVGIRYNKKKIKCNIPDMRLYGLIMFLQHNFRGNWIVENVIPYYDPLINPTCRRGRHLYWSNISIPSAIKNIKPELPRSNHDSKEERNKVNPREGKILMDYLLEKQQIKMEQWI